MKKIHLGIVIAIICSGAIIGAVMATKPKPVNQAATSEKKTLKNFTIDEVAAHTTKEDCWTAIGGKVYDITPYVRSHPGGSEILRACGKDGTSLFNTRKTAEGEEVGSGTPHSTSARNTLQQFEIGTLVQ